MCEAGPPFFPVLRPLFANIFMAFSILSPKIANSLIGLCHEQDVTDFLIFLTSETSCFWASFSAEVCFSNNLRLTGQIPPNHPLQHRYKQHLDATTRKKRSEEARCFSVCLIGTVDRCSEIRESRAGDRSSPDASNIIHFFQSIGYINQTRWETKSIR